MPTISRKIFLLENLTYFTCACCFDTKTIYYLSSMFYLVLLLLLMEQSTIYLPLMLNLENKVKSCKTDILCIRQTMGVLNTIVVICVQQDTVSETCVLIY